MHPRKYVLLRFVQKAGGSIERLRLVKLMFLYSSVNDVANSLKYDFVPYRQGPFSFAMYRDWTALVESGLALESDDNHFALTDEGYWQADATRSSVIRHVDELYDEWSDHSTDELIDHVYAIAPWFTHRSDRAGGIYKREMPIANLAVYSVGYQQLSIDAFLNLLLKTGIKALVDIRNVPMSRTYGFHARTLANMCKNVDIEYHLERSLGVPKSVREKFWLSGDYLEFERSYDEILLANSDSVLRVADTINCMPTAVMCLERNVDVCHRKLLARKLVEKTGLDWVEVRNE